MGTANQTMVTGLPKPKVGGSYYCANANVPSTTTPYQSLLIRLNSDGSLANYIGANNVVYYGSFSYPVAES